MATRLSTVGHLARGLTHLLCSDFPEHPDQRPIKTLKNPKKHSPSFVILNIVYEIQ